MHKKFGKQRDRFTREAGDDISLARKKHLQARAEYPLSKPLDESLDLLTTEKRIFGFLPMSNFAVRRVASKALINALLRLHDQNRKRSVKTYLFTATFDDGIIVETAAQLPLYTISRKVRSALARYALDAICLFEIDILKRPLPGENARSLLIHVHAVCWTSDPKFRAGEAAIELNKQRRFRHRLGVPAIKFRTRKQAHAHSNNKLPAAERKPLKKPRKDQIASSMARMGWYMLKAPIHVKDRRLSDVYSTSVRPEEQSLKTSFLLTEIWSRISASDVAFAVGREATAVVEDYRAALRHWEQGNRRHGVHLDESEVASTWRRIAAEQPKLRIIDRSAVKRPKRPKR